MLSRHGASESRTKNGAPLTKLRLAAGLSLPLLAEQFKVSCTTVGRWCSGERRAPASFLVFLQAAAIGAVPELRERQERWRERHRTQSPTVRIELRLPTGITPEAAREKCVEALDSLAGEGTGQC